MEHIYRVEKMADLLGVSRSGYYDWRDRPASSRMIRNQKIVQDIKNIQKESRDYGCPRITNALRMRYGKIGHNRVARLMRENGLLARPKRRFVHTTDSNHGLIVAPNLLNRNFQTVSPNTVWVSDITYIRSKSGWMYLCVFLDLYSRRVVGWSLDTDMRASLVIRAWKNALAQCGRIQSMIVHSDRGIQYCCQEFRMELEKVPGVQQSMSRKGNCWDNACAESFFSTLKREIGLRELILRKDDLQAMLFEYIDGYYNTRRSHSYLGYRSPSEFETEYAFAVSVKTG